MTTTTPVRQCPTCGRCDEDWTAPSSAARTDQGVKARQRSQGEDRTLVYRDWRRTLGARLYVNDVDQVEWRIRDEQVVPVAVLELTRVNGDLPVPAGYFAAILTRMRERDSQAKFAREVALRLGVYAFVVVFRYNCEDFWIYNLSADCGWFHQTAADYAVWLAMLNAAAPRREVA